MPGSINKVVLLGNLGGDPELRSLPSGGDVVSFNLATSDSWKDRQGERQERTEWHKVVIFNEALGRVAKSYLRKGSKVYLEGQIQTRKWTNEDGLDRYTTEVVLQKFRGDLVLLDGRDHPEPLSAKPDPFDREARSFRASSASARSPALPMQAPAGQRDALLDDDVPF